MCIAKIGHNCNVRIIIESRACNPPSVRIPKMPMHGIRACHSQCLHIPENADAYTEIVNVASKINSVFKSFPLHM